MRAKILMSCVSALAFTACLNFNAMDTYAGETRQFTQNHDQKYYRETQAGNYLAGRFAQRSQDWYEASNYLNKLIALDPDNGTLQQRAMILAIGSGQMQQAYKLAREIMPEDPSNLWAILTLTLEALVNNDFKNADALLDTMPEDSIQAYVAPIIKTWIKASEKQIDTSTPDNNTVHLMHIILAADYLNQSTELSAEIENQIKQAILDPRDAERVADIYAMSGRTDQALEFYRVLHTDNPADIGITDKISRLEAGESISDLMEYEQLASPSAGIARAFFDLARIFYREYNDESAQIFAQMSLAMNAAQTEAKILLAHIQTRHGRYEDAIEYYTSVGRDDPNYLSIQYQSAELLADLDRTEDAITLLKNIAQTHNDIQAFILLGDLYRREDNFDMAIETYSQAFDTIGTKIPDEYWSIYYARGMAYEQMGEWKKAEADLRKALDYQPNHPYLLNYLGYSLADRGKNLNEALDMIAKAVDLRPNDGYITDSLGWVYYRLGEYEKALPPLERAVELLPYDPVINDHLGDAYWQVGRKMEAQFQWRRAMNNAEDDDELIATIEDKLQFGLTTKEAKDYTYTDDHSDQYKTLNP